MPPTATCRHCGQPIVFKPYYLFPRGPNPPCWWHPPGSFTCAISGVPEGQKWPVAEPEES